MQNVALIIMDGWGINQDPKVSAVAKANTPVIDSMLQKFPNATLTTFGEQVGLPDGQMGNSEVGHINIGAGRVVYQELARINKAIREKELYTNPTMLAAIQHALTGNKRIHLMGLVSDGGVHSHINHLLGLCDQMKNHPELNVYIHAFLDGRDTDPKSGINFIQQVKDSCNSNVHIASIVGRYFAMDRDKRWERVKTAYDLLVNGIGEASTDMIDSIHQKYESQITDEFMPPIFNANLSPSEGNLQPDDVVIFFNFRTDRPRQLTEVLTQHDFPDYDMKTIPLHYVTFANYDQTFKGLHVIFEKENVGNTLGDIISQNGGTQLRIAETEKYPHVTFFFNGGVEKEFSAENRILIPSPKVATYDLQPEMSAVSITDALIQFVVANQPNFICLNYANADMVGHTGVFDAAVTAVETVDTCIGRLWQTLSAYDYNAVIIADHGNSDVLINPDGSPNTAHTTNPVPIIIVGNNIDKSNYDIHDGKLGDIAPSILHMMGIPIPSDMSGDIIFNKK